MKKQITIWTLKVRKDGETVHSTYTRNYKRFSQLLSLDLKPRINSSEAGTYEFYIKADYGKQEDIFGDVISFINEGTYTDYEHARDAAISFGEVAREWEKV